MKMSDDSWFTMRPQKAQAFGRPEKGGFLVREGSTAMLDGSPRVKRDREERDRLVRQGVFVPYSDPVLYRFSRDHLFGSASVVGVSSRTVTAVCRKAGTARVMGKPSRRSHEN